MRFMRLPEIMLAIALSFHQFSCNKVTAGTATAVIASADQAACTLVEVVANNQFAGTVCEDVATVINQALAAIKADSSPGGAPCQLAPLFDGPRNVGATCIAYHDVADSALKVRAAAAKR